MVAFEGHFDGKVIVPDGPVDLPANQRLIVQVQPVTSDPVDFTLLIGIANRVPENPRPRFRDDDELWG